MSRNIDSQILQGFVEEARGYLPSIRQAVETALDDPTRLDALEEAHRHLHSIKGAASMVGLAPLAHIAFYGEEAVEQIGEGELPLDLPTTQVLQQTVDLIARYLNDMMAGHLDPRPIVRQTVTLYRRLRGLPESGDKTEFARLMPPGTAPTEAAPTDTVPIKTGPIMTSPVDTVAMEAIPGFPETTPAPPPASFPNAPPAPPPRLDDVSDELLDAFLEEADDHLQTISQWLRVLEKKPDDQAAVQQVRRRVHTLKGAGAMIGFESLGQLAHRMEDLLDLVYAGSVQLEPRHLDLLFSTSDTLADLASKDVDPARAESSLKQLEQRYNALLNTPSPLEVLGPEPVINLADVPTMDEAGGDEDRRQGDRRQGDRATSSAQVRVPIERLDELVRLVSELVVQRSTFEQQQQRLTREVEELRLSQARLGRLEDRFDTGYEVLALASSQPADNTSTFDELELDRYTDFHLLSRELSETNSDIVAVAGELGTSVGDFDSYLTRMARLTSEVQDKLMRLRMVPLANLANRLHRAARVTAQRQGKLVELTLEGDQTELDKTVLEQIADPLLHLLRNAVDHGIEPPELRQVLGKPERGLIEIRAYHEGTYVVLEIHDDGAGFDLDRLRRAAADKGYVSEGEAEALTDRDLRSLVFLPGFSTASEIDEISGRGVGLDIAKEHVQRLKGDISVDSAAGGGTTFTIRLPMTLAITRVLLVEARGHTYAMPLAAVSQILRVRRDDIETIGQQPVLHLDGRACPALHLSAALNLEHPTEMAERLPVLVLSLGEQKLALLVDRIVEAREVVIKTLGNLLRKVAGLTGATLMGDGQVVLILNPHDLMKTADFMPAGDRSATAADSTAALAGPSAKPELRLPSGQRRPLDVMIVDDSVSMRRLLSNVVSQNGWNPITAKDGLEALEKIQSLPQPPDVMLLDIEMPRMDGYELTASLRSLNTFMALPIVILTSRAGEKHRQRAFEVGATEYLVKPYQDETLVNVIRRVVRERRGMTSS